MECIKGTCGTGVVAERSCMHPITKAAAYAVNIFIRPPRKLALFK
jgi:hypothetical protein